MNTETRVVLLSVAVGLIAVVGCEQSKPPATGSGPAWSAASARVTPVDLKVAVGEQADLQKLIDANRGSVVLVDYWATWCGPCKEQFPHTVKLHDELHDQGFRAIAVSMDEPSEEVGVREFLQSQRATFDNLISRHGAAQKSFDEFQIADGALPHYKLFDRQGKLRRSFSISDKAKPEEIDAAVKELLTEQAAP